jgi:sulfoxide reductase heme-binding subunit YedZ
MTPLNALFGWHSVLKLRKPAGLWAFGFAGLHFLTYTGFRPLDLMWLTNNPAYDVLMGIAALGVLTLLAVTSNRRAQRALKRWWKRLHRLVYGAGTLAAVHAIAAFSSSKKRFLQGDEALREFYLYLAILGVLLALRLPVVKQAANRLRRRRNFAPARPEQLIPVYTPPVDEPVSAPEPDPADEVAEDELLPV